MDPRPSHPATLPAEFDVHHYRDVNPDLKRMSVAEADRHYREYGLREGRRASAVVNRPTFLTLLDDVRSVLEIGPFASPTLRGPRVKYFDVLATEALRLRAVTHGLDPAGCPQIDYVSATGDLSVVPERFDAVLSSHAIEHQTDLIEHLQNVARILEPQGRYFLVVPDKRFCFDHFIAESSIADVLDAHLRKGRFHSPASVIEHLALTTHNEPARHWRGDHEQPRYKSSSASLEDALNQYLRTSDAYFDVHAWQLTPDSFRDIMQSLHALELSPLELSRVYPTTYGSCEFYAVLTKTDLTPRRLRREDPPGA